MMVVALFAESDTLLLAHLILAWHTVIDRTSLVQYEMSLKLEVEPFMMGGDENPHETRRLNDHRST